MSGKREELMRMASSEFLLLIFLIESIINFNGIILRFVTDVQFVLLEQCLLFGNLQCQTGFRSMCAAIKVGTIVGEKRMDNKTA